MHTCFDWLPSYSSISSILLFSFQFIYIALLSHVSVQSHTQFRLSVKIHTPARETSLIRHGELTADTVNVFKGRPGETLPVSRHGSRGKLQFSPVAVSDEHVERRDFPLPAVRGLCRWDDGPGNWDNFFNAACGNFLEGEMRFFFYFRVTGLKFFKAYCSI